MVLFRWFELLQKTDRYFDDHRFLYKRSAVLFEAQQIKRIQLFHTNPTHVQFHIMHSSTFPYVFFFNLPFQSLL